MGYFIAASYDKVILFAEYLCLQKYRQKLVAPLRGRILELGAGTGKNLAYYSMDINELVLSEPDPHMQHRLKRRLNGLPIKNKTILCDSTAEQLPFDSNSFDHVVSTLVLCSVNNLSSSLTEVRRILVKGGKLSLLEHIAACPDSLRHAVQQRLDPYWSKFAGGCHLNRDPRKTLEKLGFQREFERVTPFLGAPQFLSPLLRGVWTKL
jgi:ubiquinone/menaquinone biosynthesis C-methylase UbiE